MEGINSTTEAVTNGTTNGTPSACTTLTPKTATDIEKQHIQISHISSHLPNSSHCEIRGIITLLWPYSSLTKSLALNLAEKDVRLRTNKGQVKISFTGQLGKHVGAQGLNIDDELVLSLEGAEIVKTQPRDSRDVGYELRYTKKLVGRITSRPNGDVMLDHEAQDEVAIAPVIPLQTVVEIASPARSPPRSRVGAIQNEDGEWASPAFIKRARLSYGSLMSEEFDAFIGEDGTIPGKGRKKAKFEPRKSGTWRYQSEPRSPSPEPEAEEDTPMKEVELEKSRAVMMEQGCQTDDLEYNDAEVQEFFRRSQAIGREVRHDQRQHINEGAQIVFGSDHAEMFSPITFPAPSTTPFGKPPVPLFGQTQPSTTPFGEPSVQASTTPFGAPTTQMSTTPSEPLPEQYEPLLSPLASRSTAPVHEEGQWPASLFETMGYKPNTFSKSATSSTFAQSTNLETLSPVKPTFFRQGVQDDENNSAALTLEELSKIHHAQQVEDAMVDYDDPANQVLQGSLNEVAPALSPPTQSEYPGLLEYDFLTPAKPNYGSRHQSPQYQSQPRQGAISYPAERYSKERSGTPQNRQKSPMPTSSPFQRAGSQSVREQSETIDLTGESDDEDESQEEEYSEDEQEQVIPGESFEETRDRLLNESDSEEEEGSGMEDEENMTEVRIPSWRGQSQKLSMIPKSREYVDEEDDLSGEEEMHSDEGDGDEEGQEYEEEDNDERILEGYGFTRRDIVLNPPKPRVLGDRTTEGMNAVQDELDEDAEGDYDSDERPPSLKEQFSDDDGDAENYGIEYDDDEEDIQSDLDPGPVDPDNAIMPGEDTEQSWDEEEEEEREEEDLEYDEEQWEGQEARDIGPAYGQSANNSRSQSSGPPEVIDLLSSDEDEPAALKRAAAPASPPPAPRQDHQQATQPDDCSGGDQDMESGSEHSDEQLDVEGEEQLSEAESGHEDATEIAEQERYVYDEEHDDSSCQSIQTQEDRVSPAPQNVEDAQAAAEGSGYEDEDATAEEIQSPRDMVGMDGGWESKPVKDTPEKNLFQPLTQSSLVKAAEELPLLERIESVEPPAQKEGEDADIEDAEFEVPKENFDEAEKVTPVDPALWAERDEDTPVEATLGRSRQGAYVEAMDEHVPQTATSSPIKAKKRDDAVKQLATAALMAERDEDRPVQATETSNVISTLTKSSPVKQARSPQLASSSPAAMAQLATASLMAERDEGRPVQASQSTTNTTPKKDAEAALLACEQKLDQEMDEELRVSKDQELTEEAEHDMKMAEVITSPAKTEERKAIENEIAQDVCMAESSEHQGDTSVPRDVEPGPRGDPEDVEMDGDVRPTDGGLEASSPAPSQHEQHGTVKSTVEPGPRCDPEDIEMDGDIKPSAGSLNATSPAPSQHNDDASQDVQIEPRSDATVPSVIISEVSPVAFDVEEQYRDEDDYEDPSSQLFEEMSYIDQAEEVNTLVVEELQGSDGQFFVSQTTQNTEAATQQSQMASVFSEEATDTAVISFQALPASAQLVEDQEKAQDIEGDVEEQEVESVEVEDASKDAPAPAADESVPVDIEEHPATHTRSHDKQPKSSPAKTQAVPEPFTMNVDEHLTSHTRSQDQHKASPKLERADSPAAHTRPHDAAGECVEDDNAARAEMQPSPKQADVQDVEMQSIEEDEHPAAHTRSHDKRVEKLQESDKSGSPAEHTRSHDALAGHCVEDDESAKGLQRSTRRKSSSRKSTEQPPEHTTPSESAPEPAVEPVVEVPVTSSAVENVQETPPKRVTRSRRGTLESVSSPPKTRKRALAPIIEVPLSSNQEGAAEPAEGESSPQQPARATRSRGGTQESVKPSSPSKTRKRALSPVVVVPVSSIEETEAAPAEPKPAPEPPKRVTRARSASAQPVLNSPPKTTKTQSSLGPIIEVPASSIIENVQEESVAAASPPQRATRARKVSIQSAPKATTPPRTRRMSARSQASPDTTNMSEISGSIVLKAIDEEDDELSDPGAAAILEYDDSPQKPASKPNVTSAPAPVRNLRSKRNESVELDSSGQAIPETPVKTRTRALRGHAQAQASSQPAEAESTPPADPRTPANKSTSTRTSLVSPSQWATLTPQAVAAQITKTLRTQLPAYTPLKNIKNHLKKKIDVLAVCVATPEAATKGNKTPHDYVLKFFVTEPGSFGTVKEVTAFHHFKKCLPVMCAGNVVLLRNFLVDGQNNGCLRSEKDSNWAVWRKDDQEPEINNAVPLEFEGGEDEYAKQLKLWWEEKVEAAQKDKMKAIAEKGKAKK